jgi:hypothetical protein
MGRSTLLGAVFLVALAGCDSKTCERVVKKEVTSPQGDLIAYVIEQNCGATTR